MSQYDKKTLIEIETYIAKLEQDTGVSKRFLEAARSSIERAFLEVPVERRSECLEAIEQSCKTQAATERSIARSMANAKKLAAVEKKLSDKLAALKTETKLTRDRVTAVAFNWGLKRDTRWDVN